MQSIIAIIANIANIAILAILAIIHPFHYRDVQDTSTLWVNFHDKMKNPVA